MIKNYITVEKAMERVKRTAVKVVVGATFVITLFSFSGVDAQAAENITYTMPTTAQTEHVMMMDKSMVSVPVETGQHQMAVQMELLKYDTVDKLTAAFFSLGLDVEEYPSYSQLFVKMAVPLSKIDIVKATADTDNDDKSLELVLLLDKGVMVSVEKPFDTIDNNNALVTFVHQGEVLYSNVMDIDAMSHLVQTMESKLHAM